jgi:hypothetical protein
VKAERAFKTAWFSKVAKKSRITDGELCSAIGQVMLGQADDLGGGVFKKRLGKNMYRSSFLPRGAGIGYSPTCLLSRTGPILMTMNSGISAL